MQNQINTNPESPDTVTIHTATPQFIIGPGGVVNLAGLVSSGNSAKSGMSQPPIGRHKDSIGSLVCIMMICKSFIMGNATCFCTYFVIWSV